MRELVFSPKFERAYRRFVKRDKGLRRKVDDALGLMKQDVYSPSLHTHKLSGELRGLFGCSCGYDRRIVFFLDTVTDRELIVLVDIGTHDEVY